MVEPVYLTPVLLFYITWRLIVEPSAAGDFIHIPPPAFRSESLNNTIFTKS